MDMMCHMKPAAYLLALFFALSACTDKSADKQMLEEAAAIHLEADQLQQAVKPLIDELVQRKNSINIQGRALQAEELDFLAGVESVETAYRFYIDNHAEVPGFEHHDHDHDHDHDHHHGPQTKITAKHALAIQQELRDSLLSAKGRAEALLQRGL
jgi:ABC-type nickel/cobalt efflux system permease component RcnA